MAISVPLNENAPSPTSEPAATSAPVAPLESNDNMSVDFDAAVASVISGSQDVKPTMQSSVARAINTDPDYEAELRRVSARTGAPLQTVAADPDRMKNKAALGDFDFDTYQKMFPSSAAALSDVEFAKIAHDDTQNMGYLENTLRGIGGRAVNLAGGLTRFGYTVSKAIAGEFIPEVTEFSQGMQLPGESAISDMQKFSLGYTPRTTWEDVKNRPLAEFLPFAMEQGLISAPDMVAAIFAPQTYFPALIGEFGQNRAENDQRREATLGDFAEVAPAAAINALLERFATKGIIGAGEVTQTLKQLGKATLVAAAKEGSTEALQNVAQYEAETLGTKKGATWAGAGEQALQGAVAGGPFGGAVRGVTGSVQMVTQRHQNRLQEATTAEQNATDFGNLNAQAAE